MKGAECFCNCHNFEWLTSSIGAEAFWYALIIMRELYVAHIAYQIRRTIPSFAIENRTIHNRTLTRCWLNGINAFFWYKFYMHAFKYMLYDAATMIMKRILFFQLINFLFALKVSNKNRTLRRRHDQNEIFRVKKTPLNWSGTCSLIKKFLLFFPYMLLISFLIYSSSSPHRQRHRFLMYWLILCKFSGPSIKYIRISTLL